MTDPNKISRVDRHSKRRNNRIQLIVLIILAVLCLVLLISLMVKGDKNTKENNDHANGENKEEIINEENEKESNDIADENETKEEKETNENTENETNAEQDDGVMKKEDYPDDLSVQTMHTTDENVEEAIVADWPAIGTNQTGTHIVNFDNDSEDRKEIKQAITYVTDLTKDDMIEHWVGNGGDQKVIATVSDKNQDKKYKVYLEWEIDQGWKPTKVEKLKSISTE